MRFDFWNTEGADHNDGPHYSKVQRQVYVSEEELQTMAFFINTHPERSNGAVKVIARLISAWQEPSPTELE